MKPAIHPLLTLAMLLVASTCGRGELLVSSFSSNRVLRYHENTGAFIDVFVPNTDGALSLPHGLAFGPDGNLYVASAGNDRVVRYNGTTGAFIDVFIPSGNGGLDYPVALLFDRMVISM
jgi:DNA-binding beta-propeller fold protein YncE